MLAWLRIFPFRVIVVFGLAAITVLAQSASKLSSNITVTIEGIKSNKGPIQYAFYDSKPGFDKGVTGVARKGTIPVQDLKCEFVITNVPYGSYAIMVGQDLNNNGEIDWHFFGTTEPYGVSNYTNSLLWYPSFEKAKFLVVSEKTQIAIKLH